MLPSQLEVELREFIRRLRIEEDTVRLVGRDIAALYSDLGTVRRARIGATPACTITITGTVHDNISGAGIASATVTVTDAGTGATLGTFTTAPTSGAYSGTLATATDGESVTVTAVASGYATGTAALTAACGGNIANFALTPVLACSPCALPKTTLTITFSGGSSVDGTYTLAYSPTGLGGGPVWQVVPPGGGVKVQVWCRGGAIFFATCYIDVSGNNISGTTCYQPSTGGAPNVTCCPTGPLVVKLPLTSSTCAPLSVTWSGQPFVGGPFLVVTLTD